MYGEYWLTEFFYFKHGGSQNATLKKQAYLTSIRLRGTYGSRAIFVSGDVRFQDGDAIDVGKLGGGRFHPFFYFLSMFYLR